MVGHALYVPHDPLASLDATAKVKLLERLEAYARAEDPRVTQVMAHIAGEYEVVLIAGSDGRLAADIRPLVRVSITVFVEDAGGKREQGSSGGGGRTDYGFFTDDVLRRYARGGHSYASTVLAHQRPVRRVLEIVKAVALAAGYSLGAVAAWGPKPATAMRCTLRLSGNVGKLLFFMGRRAWDLY